MEAVRITDSHAFCYQRDCTASGNIPTTKAYLMLSSWCPPFQGLRGLSPLSVSLFALLGVWGGSSPPVPRVCATPSIIWYGWARSFTRTCTFALLWSVEGRHSLPPTLLSSPTSGKANNNHLLFFFYAAKGVRVCGPLRDIAHWNREAEKLRKVQKQPQTPAFPPKPLVLYTTQEDRGAVRTDTLPCFRRDCQKNAVLQRGVARTKGNYRQGDAERFPQGVEGG